jgi:hypothetical protein
MRARLSEKSERRKNFARQGRESQKRGVLTRSEAVKDRPTVLYFVVLILLLTSLKVHTEYSNFHILHLFEYQI